MDLDIDSIAKRVRLAPRKVRYVLDQRLLPGMRGRPQKNQVGQRRAFTVMEGFFIALAALLREAGVKRGTISDVLGHLAQMPWPILDVAWILSARQRLVARPDTGLAAVYVWACEPSRLQIGDGANLRLLLGKVDSGWLAPPSWAPLVVNYVPYVVVDINVGQLRTKFEPGSAGRA